MSVIDLKIIEVFTIYPLLKSTYIRIYINIFVLTSASILFILYMCLLRKQCMGH